MGLDVGAKVVGVALSDPLRLTAKPLTTLRRTTLSEDATRLAELATENGVRRFIVGRPLHLSGEKSGTLETVEMLVKALESFTDIPVVWAEERLSSKEAEALMAQMGVKASKRRGMRDQWAAALILQWYIEDNPGGF